MLHVLGKNEEHLESQNKKKYYKPVGIGLIVIRNPINRQPGRCLALFSTIKAMGGKILKSQD
jgi:hypothetical protein